ncbi:unnamed protein product [Anisakis simplex]|uniref:DUF3395 domain-containing protein n=1 Tax=Anisakis simplex TaxID=6269 RepID=A0A0M3J8J0_ANISI|nr:unnamed protein product [Anisakis simplex]
MKYDSLPPMSGILNFDQTIDSVAFTPAKGLRIRQQKVEPLDDASRQLIEVMEDSFAIEPLDERKEREKMRHRIELKKIEPEFDIAYAIPLQESFVTKMRAKRSTLVDQSLFNIRRTRIGWTHGGLFVSSALPASFDVHLIKIDYPDELPQVLFSFFWYFVCSFLHLAAAFILRLYLTN